MLHFKELMYFNIISAEAGLFYEIYSDILSA